MNITGKLVAPYALILAVSTPLYAAQAPDEAPTAAHPAAPVLGAEQNAEGTLVDYNSTDRRVLIETTKGDASQYWRFRVADDARWHICLKDKCLQTTGADGFQKLESYAEYEPYGLPSRGYNVVYDRKGETITRIDVEIAPGRHKEMRGQEPRR